MPYAATISSPTWTFDGFELERQVAVFAATAGIATQTAWLSRISTLTAGEQTTAVKAILGCLKCSVP